MASTVYSKEGETTKCQRRYWKVWRFWGMYLVSGLALMAKSMQARCKWERDIDRAVKVSE